MYDTQKRPLYSAAIKNAIILPPANMINVDNKIYKFLLILNIHTTFYTFVPHSEQNEALSGNWAPQLRQVLINGEPHNEQNLPFTVT